VDSKAQKLEKAKNQNNIEVKNTKIYNLEERFQDYFNRVIILCKKSPNNPITKRIIPQLIASSGSIPANYAEATDAMSKKDFVKSIKISRKETKESKVWTKGLKTAIESSDSEFDLLLREADEITYILTSILKKTDIK
jgi:four helix bundle protein